MKFFANKTQLIEQFDPNEQKTIWLFASENSFHDVEFLINYSNYHNINISGGIFPRVIYNGSAYKKGMIAGFYNMKVKSYLFGDFDDAKTNESKCNEIRHGYKQAYLLIDGLSPQNANMLQLFNQHIGKQVTMVGGGAGYSNFAQKPCIFDNTGIWQNVALVFPIYQSFNLNIGQGWEPLGPIVVSNKTSENYFVEFNWRNAYQYYSYLIETSTGEKMNLENFSAKASNYPLGIFVGDNDYIIRDLIQVNVEGHIATTMSVNEHAMLKLMHGTPAQLIESTRKLLSKNLDLLQMGDQVVVFHSLLREVCMGDMFAKEIELVNNEITETSASPVVGAVSLGEILSGNHGNIIFQNKSIVSNIIQHV